MPEATGVLLDTLASDTTAPTDTIAAAIDLGSNSFHMLVARLEGPGFQVIDRLRDPVRLAAGLKEDHRITPEARARALDCLRRFHERIEHLPAGRVRAVGTYTLRKARQDGRAFAEEASEALGHPIEIIAGREEARLVWLGATYGVDLGNDEDHRRQRLVVDIGGGSTELIIGVGPDPIERDSVQAGCVRWTQKHLPPDQPYTDERMRQAIVAARLELRALERPYRDLGWDLALGSSGTIRAVETVLLERGWATHGIDREGLDRLVRAIVQRGSPDKLDFPGLTPERRGVFAGGVAVLKGVFESLRLDHMTVSTGALREGVLLDMLGRWRNADVRSRTVRQLQERFGVDAAHSDRVFHTAELLFAQAAPGWDLPLDDGLRLLRWAADLHEIGLAISHAGYHKHGAYLLQHADLPGFSKNEQEMIAALVLVHRRRVQAASLYPLVSRKRARRILRLGVFLRLAVRLNRKRSIRLLPPIAIWVRGNRVELRISAPWLAEHPLTHADLLDEAAMLRFANIRLQVTPTTE